MTRHKKVSVVTGRMSMTASNTTELLMGIEEVSVSGSQN